MRYACPWKPNEAHVQWKWNSCASTHVFAGDFWPSSGLKASVEARSFKKELIVLLETRVDVFLQAYLELRYLGFGHVIFMTNAKKVCEGVDRVLPGELGCGWSNFTFT